MSYEENFLINSITDIFTFPDRNIILSFRELFARHIITSISEDSVKMLEEVS